MKKSRKDVVEQALTDLIGQISVNWEYPEAEWFAICKHNLSDEEAEELRRRYDDR